MDTTILTQFASAAEPAESGNFLAMLGIDWKLLAFQIVAFLLLVVILGKWVFPVFFKIIDKRQEAIEASNLAAVQAGEQAEKAQYETEKLLAKARKEAGEIVSTAKDEATAMVAKAEEKSKAQAEAIVSSAQVEIEKEVVAAKKALQSETIELVAQATEKVIGTKLDKRADEKLITDSLKGAK